MRILQLLTMIVGIAMSLGYFPQAYRLWKTKNADSLSIPTFVIFAVGTAIWTVYGIALGDFVLICSFTIGVIGSWLCLGLALYYRNR